MDLEHTTAFFQMDHCSIHGDAGGQVERFMVKFLFQGFYNRHDLKLQE